MKFKVIQSQPTFHVVEVVGPPGVTGRLKIRTTEESVGFEIGAEFSVKGPLDAAIKAGTFVPRTKEEPKEESAADSPE